MNKIYKNNILPLINLLNSKLNEIGKQIFKYKSIVTFKDLFYIISLVNNNSLSSYSIIIDKLNTEEKLDVTKSAIIKKRKKCQSKYFQQINDHLLDFIYKDTPSRLLAVDSTLIYVYQKLQDEGVSLCLNNHYCKLRINAIFDVDSRIPINYIIGNQSERPLLEQQMNILKSGDIVLHDRGYYSDKLLVLYHLSKADAIFRINETAANIKLFKKYSNDFVINKYFHKEDINIKIRYIKYKINTGKGNRNYYICTTLTNSTKFNYNYFIESYNKRWAIETHFNQTKYDFSLNNIKSKSLNNVKQDIYINQSLSIINSYIEHKLTPFIKKSFNEKTEYCKINSKSCINLLNGGFRILLYESNTLNSHKYFSSMTKTLIKSAMIIKKFRSYDRIRKKPRSKWTLKGTTCISASKKNEIKKLSAKIKGNKISNKKII